MILTVDPLLNEQELAHLRGFYDSASSQDGADTADGLAALAKRNRELQLSPRQREELNGVVFEALNRTGYLSSAVLPKLVSNPILSFYQPGMAYGSHIDSAVGEVDGETFRSDVSCTIFLDDPGAYEGGELFIETEYGDQAFKLPAGHAVLYPTLFTHQVRPVTEGTRRVCIFWAQSLVRDPQRRVILHELAQTISWVGHPEVEPEELRATLVKVRENLYRQWLDA